MRVIPRKEERRVLFVFMFPQMNSSGKLSWCIFYFTCYPFVIRSMHSILMDHLLFSTSRLKVEKGLEMKHWAQGLQSCLRLSYRTIKGNLGEEKERTSWKGRKSIWRKVICASFVLNSCIYHIRSHCNLLCLKSLILLIGFNPQWIEWSTKKPVNGWLVWNMIDSWLDSWLFSWKLVMTLFLHNKNRICSFNPLSFEMKHSIPVCYGLWMRIDFPCIRFVYSMKRPSDLCCCTFYVYFVLPSLPLSLYLSSFIRIIDFGFLFGKRL